MGVPTHQLPPPSVVDWVARYLDLRFRDEQTYGHLRGKNVALHHDEIQAMCLRRGWTTACLSPAEIVVFRGHIS
jgi:hypothetical protein